VVDVTGGGDDHETGGRGAVEPLARWSGKAGIGDNLSASALARAPAGAFGRMTGFLKINVFRQ
jgi:hypothetical protein